MSWRPDAAAAFLGTHFRGAGMSVLKVTADRGGPMPIAARLPRRTG